MPRRHGSFQYSRQGVFFLNSLHRGVEHCRNLLRHDEYPEWLHNSCYETMETLND